MNTASTKSEKGYYQAAVVQGRTNDWQSYVAIAVPGSVQINDACSSLSIDNTGSKLPAVDDAAANRNGRWW